MKASMFVIIAAMACFAAGAAMAGDGAETDFWMIRLPEPFGNVRMGMMQKEVEKALPKGKTHLFGEGSLRISEVSVAPDRPWQDADFHFADGKLVSAALWSGHPRGDVGGPDARRETAAFRSVAALFGAPDKEVWKKGGEGAFHESVHVWERHGATITLGQSFSWNQGPNVRDAASLVVDCVHPVPARESPFATPLSDSEGTPATGRDTAAQKNALLPPEYGLSLGMGLSPECLARLGLRRDGESNGEGDPIVRFGARLPDQMGRGDILAALENGKLVWVDVNWSYDDGWTADNPGMIRKVLDDTLLRLGPPTKRWMKETGKVQSDGTFAPPNPVEDTWHVWQWTKGDEDVLIEIRRSADARRTLRASFCAGALRRLMPEALKFPGSSEAKVEQGGSPLARFARAYPWVAHSQDRDALRQSRYATLQDCKKETACFYALWRHPIAEDAAGNPIRNASPESSDIPHPIPTLAAEHLEFSLPNEIGKPLAAIYGERATFEIVSGSDLGREDEKRLMGKWLKMDKPPLLTLREVAEYAIGNSIVGERVDFSFSSDGAWLVVESGYLIPGQELSDEEERTSARDRTIFAIPESHQREVRELLEKAAAQPVDWAESFRTPDGGESLGFLVVTRMDLGVDDDDNRPGADDLRSKAAQAGVKAGDILLSFCGDVRGVDFSKRTLRESCGEYSKMWGCSEDYCYFARMREGNPEVFSCGSGELFQCEVAKGTAFLRVAPRRFDRVQMDRLGKAFSDYLESHPPEAEDL